MRLSDVPAVRADEVVLGWGRRTVFDRASFELTAGSLAVLGPNGAGKSTLLQAAATATRVRRGRLTVLGHDVTTRDGRSAVRREVSFLPQRPGYHPGFRVEEHVEHAGWLKGLQGPELTRRVTAALDAVGLRDRAGDRLRTLSGGMLRRAAIAGAIVAGPRLLLLDEPTAGLDPEQRVSFRALVRRLAEDSAVVLSTHLVEDATGTCDDVAVLTGGRVVFQGRADELASLGTGQDGTGEVADAAASPAERGYLRALAAVTVG